jgi:hypothetical protein
MAMGEKSFELKGKLLVLEKQIRHGEGRKERPTPHGFGCMQYV